MVAANNTYYDAANMVWEWVRPDNILITLLNYLMDFVLIKDEEEFRKLRLEPRKVEMKVAKKALPLWK